MGFYLSPLVDVNEIDLSNTVPAVATSIGVGIIRCPYKGQENKQYFVSSEEELIDLVGTPIDKLDNGLGAKINYAGNYRDILSLLGFLKYSGSLYVSLVRAEGATFAGTKAVSGSSATFTAFTTVNALDFGDFQSDNSDNFADEVEPNDGAPFWLIAQARGFAGNNIRVAVCDKSTYSMIASGGLGSDPVWGGNENSTYDTFKGIDSPLNDNTCFLVVVQEKSQGEDAWYTKEIHNVSTKENASDDQGLSIYAENKINQNSKFIRFSFDESWKNVPITIATPNWQIFGGGKDYNNSTELQDVNFDARIMDAIDLYNNADEIDVNIFIETDKSSTIKNYLVEIAEVHRKDSMAILDCKYESVVNQRGSEVTNLVNYRLGISDPSFNPNTSYASIYSNWLEVYDRWNKKYRWIPSSGHAAGIYANTDDVTDPWFAPAGLNRGILQSIRRLAWNPNQKQRDILYKNGWNPIVSFAGQGKVVYGQKTLLDKESAFNRVNVRRLFLVIEKACSTAAKYFIMEPNDNFSQMQLRNMLIPFLRDVKGRRGLYDFQVVCDERNNTPERVDRNELWCDVYLKPTRTAEFVVLNFIATKTGASFNEIIEARSVE